MAPWFWWLFHGIQSKTNVFKHWGQVDELWIAKMKVFNISCLCNMGNLNPLSPFLTTWAKSLREDAKWCRWTGVCYVLVSLTVDGSESDQFVIRFERPAQRGHFKQRNTKPTGRVATNRWKEICQPQRAPIVRSLGPILLTISAEIAWYCCHSFRMEREMFQACKHRLFATLFPIKNW